jgi:hypothetical protein
MEAGACSSIVVGADVHTCKACMAFATVRASMRNKMKAMLVLLL